ncbi:MAG: aminopeptidase [Actinomycetota bacterium]|nr:aminopeptidase [Actinomycetota bacterium]
MNTDELLSAYADLAVRVGVNLQPGQHVLVEGKLEHAPLIRALTEAAYRAGAAYVSVTYSDDHVRRAMIEHGPEDALSWTPPHLLAALQHVDATGGARISVAGDAEPALLADLDPTRVGRAKMVDLAKLRLEQVNRRSVSWTIVACPNEGWAAAALGEPDVERLWDAVAKATRLYEPDPVQAWKEHLARLAERADALNERRFEAVHFRGPGTDLTVGLHEDSRWISARFATASGIRHVPNLPTEEVFTTPDFRRVEGTVAASRPLQLSAEGVTVTDLEVTFEEGRAVKVEASSGADVVRAQMAIDEGAARLGEVALVDRASAVGETGITFNSTLFDENATSHIAYGGAYTFAVDGAAGLSTDELLARGINHSTVHTDFMIGGPGVDVAGVTRDGGRITIIEDNVWQL